MSITCSIGAMAACESSTKTAITKHSSAFSARPWSMCRACGSWHTACCPTTGTSSSGRATTVGFPTLGSGKGGAERGRFTKQLATRLVADKMGRRLEQGGLDMALVELTADTSDG